MFPSLSQFEEILPRFSPTDVFPRFLRADVLPRTFRFRHLLKKMGKNMYPSIQYIRVFQRYYIFLVKFAQIFDFSNGFSYP